MSTNPLVNTATATDPASPPATGSDSDTLAAVAALAVSKTDGSPTYTPGGSATYTVVVTNAGPSNAGSVTLVRPVAGRGDPDCKRHLRGRWLGELRNGDGHDGADELRHDGRDDRGGRRQQLTFTAPVVVCGGHAHESARQYGDGDRSGVARRRPVPTATRAAAVAALAVTKTDGSATYTPGGTATYTVVVTNAGPSNANSVTLSDPLPAGVTLNANATCVASGTANCGTVTGTTGQTTFGTTGATIAAGAGNSLTFTVPVSFAAGMVTNPLVNTATATDPASPPATGSDSDARAAVGGARGQQDRWQRDVHAGWHGDVHGRRDERRAVEREQRDGLRSAARRRDTERKRNLCRRAAQRTAATVTGTTGQTSFGTTGATVGAGAGNSLTFTVPVAFAAGMVTNPLVNTATATDPASPPATGSDSDARSAWRRSRSPRPTAARRTRRAAARRTRWS